jgi:hypothetical protein
VRIAAPSRLAPAAPLLLLGLALVGSCGRGGERSGPPPPLIEIEAPRGVVPAVPEAFRWAPVPGAASYRVTVVDADTVWPLILGTATEPRLSMPESRRGAIRPGRIHEWTVDALDADGAVIGSGTVRFWLGAVTAGPVAAGATAAAPAPGVTAFPAPGAAAGFPAAPLPALALERPDGGALDPLAPGGGRAASATVFFFVRTDCPIANRYAPEMRRLAEAYAPRGVAFFVVYVDASETAEAIGRHLAEYGLPPAALRDPRHALVAATGARVTPTAAVVAADRRLVYRGRIDDRYPGYGKALREPSERDLVAALDALLGGRPVPRRETEAIGCLIGDVAP